jgi:cytochrome c oxidase assembly protein subunit 15
VIGIIYAVPLLWFAARGMISRSLLPRLLLIFALGGLQGFIGWYMVASGLVERPDVSHYRLALHLCTALLIYALTVWTICDLRQARGSTTFCQWRHGMVSLVLLATTIIYGAFVAGLDAGLAYNTFPLMDGQLVPAAIDTLNPWYMNALQNTAGVQFIHRWLAIFTSVVIVAYAWRMRAPWLVVAVAAQVVLGIVTLLSQVEIVVATLHQANAVITLTVLLVTMHRAGGFRRA